MKKFLVLLSLLFTGFAYADTITINWLNEDDTNFTTTSCTVGENLNIPNTTPTKYGYTFQGWELLPYIPLEYIQSNGTEYIDTGIKAGGRNTVEMAFSNINSAGNNVLFGEITNQNNTYGINVNAGSKIIYKYENSGRYETIANNPIFNNANQNIIKYNCVYGLFWNNTKIGTNFLCTEHSINTFIFTGNPSVGIFSQYRLYYFKITDENENLLINLLPAKDLNGVVCLYDTVSGQFFYNQGTGGFTAGPEL